jgi:hypothetical protein
MKPWKAQKFFGDVVYDLRSRGLLPVVILLVVAMLAVPMLIARGGSSSSSGSLQPAAVTAETAPEAEHAVVAYTPAGLRDYKSRLDDLSPKNPFRQAPTSSPSAAAASQLSSTAPGTGAETASSTPVSGGGSTSGGDTTSGGSTGGGKKKHKTRYSYSVTVMAGDVDATLTPFRHIAAMTPLPSQTSSVLVYYGLNGDNKRALFLVSNKVDALNGPGSCVPAPDDCSLLSLAPGESEDLHYTKDGHTYRVVVAEIKRVAK